MEIVLEAFVFNKMVSWQNSENPRYLFKMIFRNENKRVEKILFKGYRSLCDKEVTLRGYLFLIL